MGHICYYACVTEQSNLNLSLKRNERYSGEVHSPLRPGAGRGQEQSYPLSPPPQRRAGTRAVLPPLPSTLEEGGGKSSLTPSPLQPGGGRGQEQSYPFSPPPRRRAGARAVLPPLPSAPEEGGGKSSLSPSPLRPGGGRRQERSYRKRQQKVRIMDKETGFCHTASDCVAFFISFLSLGLNFVDGFKSFAS